MLFAATFALSVCLALAARPGRAVDALITKGVCRVKRVSPFAFGLSGVMVRTVMHAIALIVSVGSRVKVTGSIARGVTFAVSDLPTVAVTDKVRVDQAVNHLSHILAITIKPDGVIALGSDKRHQHAAWSDEGTLTVPCLAVKRPRPAVVRNLIAGKPADRHPILGHRVILAGR